VSGHVPTDDVRIGIVFPSTGGQKIARAVRSLRRQEPSLPIHVLIDASSNTWKLNPICPVVDDNAPIKIVESHQSVNGGMNRAVEWMRDEGFTHACLFHDDLVFSPLLDNRGYLSTQFDLIAADPTLSAASAAYFGEFEALTWHIGCVRGEPGDWSRPPAEWDSLDLESKSFWRRLCPDGMPLHTVDFNELGFYCDYSPWSMRFMDRGLRMGPTGQVVNISSWEKVGWFDEFHGLWYDSDFPFSCIVHNLPPIYYLPGAAHLHLHNQSVGFADPARGKWGDFNRAFESKFGKSLTEFCNEVNAQRAAEAAQATEAIPK
jgi:hypothetical protein